MYIISRPNTSGGGGGGGGGTSTPYDLLPGLAFGSIAGFYGPNTLQPATAAAPYVPAFGIVGTVTGSQGVIVYEGELSGFVGLTGGATYYLSETPGGMTLTPPTTPGSIVQRVGVARSSTVLVVMVDRDFIIL